ncbi:cupredoxin domain-containing protein [Noviherbaspirillum sp.]|uniref:cupredoxin domain-containing protein n=1 Tax=Noviherbaspirillum sp. TaxID=1926288 RepID=UPI002D557548|nr:cupredoxin domain-containing protein [Noviherbaspirillum sp.]HZW19705.1 cupredoxin domain-containing protein [Noviherbaspirillum sp.]
MNHALPPGTGLPRTRGLMLALALALALALSSVGAATAPKAAVHTVVIEGMQFSPAVLEVNAGDTVIWHNKDPYPHTATTDSTRDFDSGEIKPGRSWKMTAKKPGDFSYLCTLHRTMNARLVVK